MHIQVAIGVRQKRPETVEAAVVVSIELEIYMYLNSCSSGVQGGGGRGATTLASVATSNSTEPISEALKQLNEKDLTSWQFWCKQRDQNSTLTSANVKARKSKLRRHTCWNCGKNGAHCSEVLESSKATGSGKLQPLSSMGLSQGVPRICEGPGTAQ